MKFDHLHRDFTIKNEDSGITSDSPFFRLPSWPPPDNWPISVDSKGNAISTFGDHRWSLEPGRYFGIDFVKASYNASSSKKKREEVKQIIDPENVKLYKLCIAWFLWGDRRKIGPSGLQSYAYRIRALFVLCAKEGISAASISRYPRVIEQLADFLAPGTASEALSLFHELWCAREIIGFTLLTERNLEQLSAMLPEHETQQTPYIPPRIWLYQIEKLHAFLQDFIDHEEKIIAFYHFILEAYIENHGSPNALFSTISSKNRSTKSPFNAACESNHRGCKYLGTFLENAENFGLAELLLRWGKENKRHIVSTFGGYLAMASFVANKYIINFSGMRIEESKSLRADCLKVENDPMFGDIFMLCGETTKTIADDDARWITSPSVKIAINVMTTTAKLICETRSRNPFDQLSLEDANNPHLLQSSIHPWCIDRKLEARSDKANLNKGVRYGAWVDLYPSLFDPKQLTITEEDIRIARLVTPTLDPDVYAVGNIWRFTDHQLRRTTAVNMSASDLVHDSSLQYQLKHLRRAQSLYYGQGFSHVRLNQKYASEYLRTAFEMLRRKIIQLTNERYISPLGEQHKANSLSKVNAALFDEPINKRDVLTIRNLTVRGDITWKPTFLGVCGSPDPCSYGGITNILHCGSCGNGLLDRERLPILMDFRRTLKERLSGADRGSPDFESIRLQLQALEGHINALQR
jgi:hypothetical protein